METNKTAIITGGTSGVGLSMARALVQQNYRLILIGTNQSRGKALVAELNTPGKDLVKFVALNLSDPAAVYDFATSFMESNDKLHLLANIAGVVLPKREVVSHNLEKTFAIGYLSTFILATRLAPLMEHTGSARIVNVAAAPKSVLKNKLDFSDLDFRNSYDGFKTSLATVHAKTVLTAILAEKYHAKGITVNSFHPGVVRSALTKNLSLPMRLLAKLFTPFMAKTSENGIYTCSAKELERVTGKLLVNKTPLSLNFDSDYKEMLWNKTNELLKQIKDNL